MVSQCLRDEEAAGKLRRCSSASVHTSPIGVLPKRSQPGKFRLIVDLSSPIGFSVNDGIDSPLCSLTYTSVAHAAELVASLGRGALMAKLDLKAAYRMVPVHPEDQQLLGIKWQGVTYLDQALPFGLCSAPKIFTAVADGLEWAMRQEGVNITLHYLDDFFFTGRAGSQDCAKALGIAIPLCSRLGFPVAPHKVEGPSTTLTFLGILIDSERQILCLPPDKLTKLKDRILSWQNRQSASKHQLQELLGHLNHAAAVVRPGRSFLRSIIEAMKRPRQPHHFTRLNKQCQADLAWWALFLADWNGVSFFPPGPPHTTVISDASGSWGCGAFNSCSGEWFQLQWPVSWQGTNIAIKEMVPIILATAVWGSQWSRHRVHFLSDNMAVVAALSSRSARDPHLAHLLRCLFFWEAHYSCDHSAGHIAGSANGAADALSRNRMVSFFSLFSQAQPAPTPLPAPLVSLVMDPSLTWTSPRWNRLFRSTLNAA